MEVIVMGWSRKRTGLKGQVRYTAYYPDARGKTAVAGTFASKRDADKAWRTAEVRQAEGRLGDPKRGRQTFRQYVEGEWLPHHVMEVSTREGYTYSIGRHIMPWFGPMKMNQIMPSDVRECVTHLARTKVSPASIRTLKSILSAVFTTALNDQITFLHPCKGVKTPTVPPPLLVVVTPEQFDVLYQALPGADARLLVETAIESGLRWGELAELRPRDLNPATGMLTVSRVLTEVNPRFHPEGERFLVRNYPKGKKHRRLELSRQIIAKLTAHAQRRGIGPDALFFAMPPAAPTTRLKVVPSSGRLGLTRPNAAGRRYLHGTLSAYNAGPCRCVHCTTAVAAYRAKRRASGQDAPSLPRAVDTDGHIPRRWFREHVWVPALKAADLGIRVRVHDLRHAHASWFGRRRRSSGGQRAARTLRHLNHAEIPQTSGIASDGRETAARLLRATRQCGRVADRWHRLTCAACAMIPLGA